MVLALYLPHYLVPAVGHHGSWRELRGGVKTWEMKSASFFFSFLKKRELFNLHVKVKEIKWNL